MYRNLNAVCTTCASMVRSGSDLDTVAAGEACTGDVCGLGYSLGSERLATIQFPIQQYTEGFCPAEAHEQGTLFPELVL